MPLPVLDLSALRRTLTALEDSIEIVRDAQWFGQQSEEVKNTLLAGVIQNFEFVYEISVKMIKRQIELESASPQEVDASSFRDVLRLAAEKGLIADPLPWFQYRTLRNLTAHTYDHQKAQQAYLGTLRFVKDARDLLNRLESRNG